jgi:hypothetical protein
MFITIGSNESKVKLIMFELENSYKVFPFLVIFQSDIQEASSKINEITYFQSAFFVTLILFSNNFGICVSLEIKFTEISF